MPLNFCGACWPLVIGAVGIRLRLTALGLMVVAFFVLEGCLFPKEAGSRTQKNQLLLPLQKGDSRSRTRYPLQIRCPEDSLLQWQRNGKS